MQWRGTVKQTLRRMAALAVCLGSTAAFFPAAEAQTHTLRFRHLGTEQGLSQSVVMAIHQDRQGFIWLGTQDGLDRWDGAEFVHFRHHSGTKAGDSLSSNFIRALAEDSAGRLWIGTDTTGLDRYDPATGQMVHFRHVPGQPGSLSGNAIRALTFGPDGSLWVATSEAGLNRLDPATGQATVYRHDPASPGSLADDRLTSLLLDRDGRLWVGTRRGLDRFDPLTGQFSHYTHDLERPDSLGDPYVRALFEDSKGRIWVGTGGGLDLLAPDSGTFRRFRPAPSQAFGLGNPPVRALIEDQSGRIWVGTDSGIYLFDEPSGRFEHHRKDRSNPGSLSEEVIITFYRDRSGLLWIGTMGGGANIWNPATRSFSHIQSRPWEPTWITSDRIFGFAEIGETLYIATLGGGLNRLDRRSGEFTALRKEDGLADEAVMALAANSRGDLFIGTQRSGLQRYHPEKGRFESWRHDPEDPRSLNADSISVLFEDSRGRLWVGTNQGSGLDRFDEARGEFVHYSHDPNNPRSLPSNTITALAEAQDGGIFVGTNAGIAYLSRDDREIVTLKGREPGDEAQDLQIFSLFVDPSGILWAGTGNGVVRIDNFDVQKGEASLHPYAENEGTLMGPVFGIQPDTSGQLWFSTNRGLYVFDPQRNHFRTYTARHGLQDDEFNFGAHYRSRRGELFFGGNRGFNAFFPDQLRTHPAPPPVVITSILRSDRALRPESLPDDPPEIVLDHRDTSLSIEFAALDFAAPEENRYRFRLEGFDQGWSQPSKKRPATFTNLDPGTYLFRVTAASPDGEWNHEGAALAVQVLPAPWETWWAMSLYTLAALGLVWSGIRWRLAGLERASRELQALVDRRTAELSQSVEQLRASEGQALEAKMRAMRALEDALEERRKAQEASRAKSTFLSNISHELRTPLNAVLGFAQLMERDTTLRAEHRESLTVILRSGEHLLGLINDVLSFAKIESGRLTLTEAPFELRRVVRDVEDMIRVRADAKNLRLEVDVESALPTVSGDEGRLTQVLLNLLGNAVKFTDSGGVRLVVGWQAGRATFAVIDTGCGIQPTEIGQLFQPFVQARGGRHQGEGTGLGLAICHKLVALMGGELEVKSEVGVGSTFQFTVQLPATSLSEKAPRRGRVVGLLPNQALPKILIADDAAENRDLLLRLLTPLGLEARAVADGQQAVEMWSTWRPHLILMDIRMPVLDGYGAIRRIRQAEAELGGRTVVLAITATAFEHDRRRMLSAGFDDVLTKPFRSQALFDLLGELLDLRFLYQEEGREPNPAETPPTGQPLPRATREAPALPPAAAPPAPPTGASLSSPLSSPLTGRRILVVEDNEANRLVAQRALERFGCRVDVAADGELALEAAAHTGYDLIFMDLQMPRLDGLGATRRLRAEPGPSQNSPVIALTGLPTPDEYRRCLEVGMSDLLAKPFRLDELRVQVERWAKSPAENPAAWDPAGEPKAGEKAAPGETSANRAAGQEPRGPENGRSLSSASNQHSPEHPNRDDCNQNERGQGERGQGEHSQSERGQGEHSQGEHSQSEHSQSEHSQSEHSQDERALEDTREVYIAEIIKLFLETAPFQLEALKAAAISFDLDRLSHLAATLRGSSLNFSADELAAACERLETLCSSPGAADHRSQVADAIEELAIELRRTIHSLRQQQTARAAAMAARLQRRRR